MPLEIRPAQRHDTGVVLSLIKALAAYERLSDRVTATEAQLHAELFGDRPMIEVALGWEGGEAVAMALYFHNYSTFLARRGLYLEDLFVVPQARRRGHATALLRHLARLAVARGCGRFEWSVLDWNRPAIDFYRTLGAELLDDWRICRVSGDALARLGVP